MANWALTWSKQKRYKEAEKPGLEVTEIEKGYSARSILLI